MEFIADYFTRFTLVEWSLGALLFLFFIIQLIYYLIIFRRPYIYNKKKENTKLSEENLPAVSVIISAKNDSEELKKNLPYIMEQDYPNFEVVVINSGSTDDTDVVLKAAELKYENIYHTFIPEGADDVNEKKLALTLGIKAAKNDILLFTEAYCKPSSKNWIREYAKEFTNGRDIVLGFSKLVFHKKGGLRRFIRYDNLIQHLKFLSMAIVNKPFMGIGRNMAYRKEIFFENRGFSSILHFDGGEDDLYINRIARKRNTGVVVSSDSMTETDSVENFSTWRALKSKYLYTKQFYKGFSAGLFGFETFSKFMFYLFFVVTLIYSIVNINYALSGLALLLLLVRFLTQLTVINKNSRLFDSGKYHINLFLYDIIQPINNTRFRKYANNRNRLRR